MTKKQSFEEKMRANSQNIPFRDLVKYLDKNGENKRTGNGSHIKYKFHGKLVNIQPAKKNKKLAKKYQVNQILNILEETEK